MSSGRSGPAIFGCVDVTEAWAGEYVVKLRGGIDLGEAGLLREFLASKLALYFRILSPEPALVHIDQGLAELVAHLEPPHAAKIRNSIGLNFGTQLVIGAGTWPVDKSIPDAMCQSAAEIFAFDALIQNPDRRYNNPNLFTDGDSITIYDHEMGFSFLLALFPSTEPWNLSQHEYLKDHVFYQQLKSQLIDLTRFTAALSSLSDVVLDGIMADVPAEWKNDSVSRIEAHLRGMRGHAEEFAEQVERILA